MYSSSATKGARIMGSLHCQCTVHLQYTLSVNKNGTVYVQCSLSFHPLVQIARALNHVSAFKGPGKMYSDQGKCVLQLYCAL